jgi:actin-related protein
MGAQVTSVMCIEEGVAIPTTRSVLSFGGDVSPVFELKSVIGFCHCLV